jgi:hypothetical protein
MHFALASEAKGPDLATLQRIARAVERQIEHDVAPMWGTEGTVKAYRHIDHAPDDACPVLISARFTFPSIGVHQFFGGRPFALIKPGPKVSVAISHEIIEILIDPQGNRLATAPSIKPGQGDVRYLVEVCDPSEDRDYRIDGVDVSDFCTPAYYDPWAVGRAYSHTRDVKRPLEVLPEGYLSWHEPSSDTWWQLRRFAKDTGFRLVDGSVTGASRRVWIDQVTPHRPGEPDATASKRPFASWQRRRVRRRVRASEPHRALRTTVDELQR